MTDETAGLVRLLGGFRPSRFLCVGEEPLAAGLSGTRTLQLQLRRNDGVLARAILTGPEQAWEGTPAVVYCHAHGGRYDIGAAELVASRPALRPEPYGLALASRGIVALAIDMPCFGVRSAETESAAAKRHLWRGTTLFGEMLEDLSGALDLLGDWPGIDRERIGAFGISMGATLAFWLAALEPRLKCIAHLCCFADLAELVRQGE
ncbi:MAG TPA: acetylxylan esterase, partial [Beijerinckiaceae bacterium]|nr:acetylxylan esterase [Beijerinckiaceae bacterium]